MTKHSRSSFHFKLANLFQIMTLAAILFALFRLEVSIAAPIVVCVGYLVVLTFGSALAAAKRAERSQGKAVWASGVTATAITLAYVGWAFLAGVVLAPEIWARMLLILLALLSASFAYGAFVGLIAVAYRRRNPTPNPTPSLSGSSN